MEKPEIRKQMKSLIGAVPVCMLITICLEIGLAFLHRGGSVGKHAVHFAVLLLAAWAVILADARMPGVRRIRERIDQKLLSAETRKPWVDIVYAALAIIMLLHHFYVLLYYPKIPAGASKFAPIWIPFALITVLMGKLWRNKGFWIGIAFAAYMFERTCLKDPDLSGGTMAYMVSMIYALVICYGFMDVIRPGYRRGVLRVLCALWTLAALAFCCAGLYFVWTGEIIQNLGEGKTGLNMAWVNGVLEKRLGIFSNSNITGGIAASSAMFTLIGFAVVRNYASKVLYIVACFLMMVTNALAVTRSCFVMFSFSIAVMITLAIWGLIKKHLKVQRWGNFPLAIGLIVCLLGSIWGTYTLQQKLGEKFMELRDHGGIIVASAQAEEASSSKPLPQIAEREIISENLNISELFANGINEEMLSKITNGRYFIWKTSYDYANEHPKIIITGMSADGSVKAAIGREDHCHNILVQTAMEGGIVGLALYLGVLGYFFFHAYRLWKRWELPLWQRALPVPVLAILVMEMAECLTHFGTGHVPMTVMYFFMGCTVAVSRGLRRPADSGQ